jgi:hypothetical protein
MPGVYHRYVGHDNNRDFVILSQSDTRAIARIYNRDWLPQVMVEKHQMGSRTARYFVPPNHDPIAENIDARIWNWSGIFGSNMIKDMTEAKLAGVSQHYLFDDYWPGSTETSLWKNVISMLTEAASVNYATPIFVEANELQGYGKGLAEYKKSINMPLPWEGGWWRLSDIVSYEVVSMFSILKTAATHRADILRVRNDLCRSEVERGLRTPPYFYVIPHAQHDQGEMVGLVNLLLEHGVKVYTSKIEATAGNTRVGRGDIVIPLAQPFRPFIKEVLEAQVYPVRHYTPDGKIIRPYDITSWSLPLHRGVASFEVNKKIHGLTGNLEEIKEPYRLTVQVPETFWAVGLSVNRNESYRVAFQSLKEGLSVKRLRKSVKVGEEILPAGSFLVRLDGKDKSSLKGFLADLAAPPVFLSEMVQVDAADLALPRIGLVETYFHDMDAGWTRFLLDTHSIPFTVLRPKDFKHIDLSKNYDVIVFPDTSKSLLLDGKWEYQGDYFISDYPPGFTDGMGKTGVEKLMGFVERGGIIVSWGDSTALFAGTLEVPLGKGKKEQIQLPFNSLAENLKKDGVFSPGSWLRLRFLTGHPVTLGMEEWGGGFFSGVVAFRTRIPSFDMDRRVIATFPEKDILLSGYMEKEEKLSNRTAVVWLRKNKGQLVLFGFRPQFRASTQATFKLFFNSLLLKNSIE